MNASAANARGIVVINNTTARTGRMTPLKMHSGEIKVDDEPLRPLTKLSIRITLEGHEILGDRQQ